MTCPTTERPKQLFLTHRGSHYQMQRDGVYELYRGYNVPREQEPAWMREAQREVLSQVALEADAVTLESMVTRLTQMFEESVNGDSLAELLDILGSKVDRVDTFTLLRISESVLEMAEALDKAHAGHDTAMRGLLYARKTLVKALDSPFSVAGKYLEDEFYRDFLPEEKIMRRVKESLLRCQD